MAAVSRTSSLAALVAAAMTSAWLFVFDQGQMLALVMVLTILIYIRHWPNLRRIKAGTKPKIGANRA